MKSIHSASMLVTHIHKHTHVYGHTHTRGHTELKPQYQVSFSSTLKNLERKTNYLTYSFSDKSKESLTSNADLENSVRNSVNPLLPESVSFALKLFTSLNHNELLLISAQAGKTPLRRIMGNKKFHYNQNTFAQIHKFIKLTLWPLIEFRRTMANLVTKSNTLKT
jgi:hypothetical protein